MLSRCPTRRSPRRKPRAAPSRASARHACARVRETEAVGAQVPFVGLTGGLGRASRRRSAALATRRRDDLERRGRPRALRGRRAARHRPRALGGEVAPAGVDRAAVARRVFADGRAAWLEGLCGHSSAPRVAAWLAEPAPAAAAAGGGRRGAAAVRGRPAGRLRRDDRGGRRRGAALASARRRAATSSSTSATRASSARRRRRRGRPTCPQRGTIEELRAQAVGRACQAGGG